jgi:hypothetical protein
MGILVSAEGATWTQTGDRFSVSLERIVRGRMPNDFSASPEGTTQGLARTADGFSASPEGVGLGRTTGGFSASPEGTGLARTPGGLSDSPKGTGLGHWVLHGWLGLGSG